MFPTVNTAKRAQRLLLQLTLMLASSFGAGGVAAAYWAAHRLVRRRSPDTYAPPSDFNIHYENVSFTSRDGTALCGWWIPASHLATAHGTIIMCHGQNGSMDGDTIQMVPLHHADFNVLMFDFRGHGRSGGHMVSLGLLEKEDILGAVDFLAEHFGIEQVGILGFSMGAAAALMAAPFTDHIVTVIADSPFYSLRQSLIRYVSRQRIPDLLAHPIAELMMRLVEAHTQIPISHTELKYWVPLIKDHPLMLIYGDKDVFVTHEEIEALAGLVRGPLELWRVYAAGHRGAYRSEPDIYNQRIIDWFNRHLAAVQPSSPA